MKFTKRVPQRSSVSALVCALAFLASAGCSVLGNFNDFVDEEPAGTGNSSGDGDGDGDASGGSSNGDGDGDGDASGGTTGDGDGDGTGGETSVEPGPQYTDCQPTGPVFDILTSDDLSGLIGAPRISHNERYVLVSDGDKGVFLGAQVVPDAGQQSTLLTRFIPKQEGPLPPHISFVPSYDASGGLSLGWIDSNRRLEFFGTSESYVIAVAFSADEAASYPAVGELGALGIGCTSYGELFARAIEAAFDPRNPRGEFSYVCAYVPNDFCYEQQCIYSGIACDLDADCPQYEWWDLWLSNGEPLGTTPEMDGSGNLLYDETFVLRHHLAEDDARILLGNLASTYRGGTGVDLYSPKWFAIRAGEATYPSALVPHPEGGAIVFAFQTEAIDAPDVEFMVGHVRANEFWALESAGDPLPQFTTSYTSPNPSPALAGQPTFNETFIAFGAENIDTATTASFSLYSRYGEFLAAPTLVYEGPGSTIRNVRAAPLSPTAPEVLVTWVETDAETRIRGVRAICR